ncbi:ribosomal protein L36 [Chloropicon primus]|uniref:Ribosomal protein L36 n=1 Tax=Chloropicon primus TaxID=1764295 RepID=A0A5B8MDR3_9CHLO|nr:ribosomal protein L36 [Chloropicon primus]UPQ97778.1 ribosomal protein L36 [Chloropicon primus]|eukprot:QDZ18569.1 ribosomal protein L36 [Chloropicon primus]
MANGIAVGLDKGHQVTKKERKAAPARRKGRLANRVKLVREIVKEVAGMAPYEKRIAELLRIGKDKRALKYAKQKLGTHVRGKRKREEVAEILRMARK